MNAVALTQTTG